MKRIKLHFYLSMFLATLSLFSVGFASWVASDNAIVSTSGMIVVDDVLRHNNYITCGSGCITKFSYFKTGFVDENGNISTTGTIKTDLTIKIDNCKNKFADCNTLEVNLNLESEFISIFNNPGISLSVEIKNGDQTIATSSAGILDNMHLAIFDISNFQDLEEDVELNVVYTFTIIDQEYYTNTVYDALLQNKFNFVLSAKLTGKVV